MAESIEAYADAGLTQPLSSITWGEMLKSVVTSVTVYVRNSGDVPVRLTLSVSNPSPGELSGNMVFTTDYNGQIILIGDIIPLSLQLVIGDPFTSTAFSFNLDLDYEAYTPPPRQNYLYFALGTVALGAVLYAGTRPSKSSKR